MNQPATVRVIQASRNLCGDCCGCLGSERSMTTDSITQSSARHVRHHEVYMIVDHSEIDDLADVRVHQLRCRFRLTLEPLAHLVLARQMRMQHLDHHWRVERDIQGVINAGHAAFADAMHDRVASARNLAQRRHRWIRRRLPAIVGLRHPDTTAYATRRLAAIPASTISAEHRQPPNCMRTKS